MDTFGGNTGSPVPTVVGINPNNAAPSGPVAGSGGSTPTSGVGSKAGFDAGLAASLNPDTYASSYGVTPSPTLPSSVTSDSLSTSSSSPSFQQPDTPSTYNTANIQFPSTVSPYDTLNPEQQKESDLNKSIQDLNTSLAGEGQFKADQYKALGFGMTYDANGNIIPDAGTADLSAKLTALQNDAQAIPIRNDQAGVGKQSTYGVQVQNAADLRNNAVAALEVSSLIAAKNGQLTTAEHYVNNAVIQKYGAQEAQLAAQTANLKLIQNSPEYSNAQKKQAAEAQAQVDAQKATLDQQKADYTAVQKVATDAAAQAKNFVATPQYPTVSAALTAIQKAKTPAEAQAIAAQTGMVAPIKQDTSVVEVGGRKVLVNNQTGDTVKDLGPSTNVSTSNAESLGTALSDAQSAISQGADPEAVRKAFLGKHPSEEKTWEAYFTKAGDTGVNYPTPATSSKPWWQFW